MIKNADKIGGGTTALNDKRITNLVFFSEKPNWMILQLIINGSNEYSRPSARAGKVYK